VFSNEDYLADLLAEAGLVSADQITRSRQMLSGRETLIENLLATTSLTQEDVAHTLAANANVSFVTLSEFKFDLGITETTTDEVAKRYRVIPVMDDGLYLTVAVAEEPALWASMGVLCGFLIRLPLLRPLELRRAA